LKGNEETILLDCPLEPFCKPAATLICHYRLEEKKHIIILSAPVVSVPVEIKRTLSGRILFQKNARDKPARCNRATHSTSNEYINI
jgi:hypothetical protein